VVKDAGLGRARFLPKTEGNSRGGLAVCRAMIDDGVRARRNDVYIFFGLACGITWALDLPLALAWAANTTPPSYAMPMVGLGALGPSLGAFILAARRGELRDVFGRWRTPPIWIVLGLMLPMLVQLPATVIEVALGGHPAHWLYPPVRPEHFAALVMFPLGEEFGWRGFAYPRLAQRHGPVVGSLILGAVWGLWHLGMLFAPDPLRALPATTILVYMLDLALWSVVVAWMFERGSRSIAVAIAIHAGGHLDNISRAPETEVRLRILRILVLAVVAGFAAHSLTRAKDGGEVAPAS
jgi:membrane protease YdiL (CAAX protease family)